MPMQLRIARPSQRSVALGRHVQARPRLRTLAVSRTTKVSMAQCSGPKIPIFIWSSLSAVGIRCAPPQLRRICLSSTCQRGRPVSPVRGNACGRIRRGPVLQPILVNERTHLKPTGTEWSFSARPGAMTALRSVALGTGLGAACAERGLTRCSTGRAPVGFASFRAPVSQRRWASHQHSAALRVRDELIAD